MLASPLLLGLLLGVRHAADADHVATIATVVAGRSDLFAAVRTAVFWGLGHTVSFFAVGLAIVLFGLRVPGGFELGVQVAIGASLVLLGVGQLLRVRAGRHVHAEHPPHAARPLVLGCMHGLAGSAAVALLALAAIPVKLQALLYLALFGLGTVIGMVAITLALAFCLQLSASFDWMHRGLIAGTGLASTGYGISIVGELLI